MSYHIVGTMCSFAAPRGLTMLTFRARFTHHRWLTVCTLYFLGWQVSFGALTYIVLTTFKVKEYKVRYIVLFTLFDAQVAFMIVHDVYFAGGAVIFSANMLFRLPPIGPHHFVTRGALPPLMTL
jgi:hypothetical protein